MAADSPRIRSLLRQANRTENAGKFAAAEQLYRQVLDEAPESVLAWLGLARVVRDQDQKDAAYHQVLVLDPGNEIAQEGLEPGQSTQVPGREDGSSARVVSKAQEPSEETRSEKADIAPDDQAHDVSSTTVTGTEQSIEEERIQEQDTVERNHVHDPISESEVLFCANHPGRETYLRCNRCGKPICSSCAQPTPVGYRCPECIREHEDIYYTATPVDYIVAVAISLPLSFVAGYIASLIGFFAIFLAAIVGSFLGRVVFRATGRRRGRGMPQLVAAAVVIGALLPLLGAVLSGNILRMLFLGIYVFAASGAAYYQMR